MLKRLDLFPCVLSFLWGCPGTIHKNPTGTAHNMPGPMEKNATKHDDLENDFPPNNFNSEYLSVSRDKGSIKNMSFNVSCDSTAKSDHTT